MASNQRGRHPDAGGHGEPRRAPGGLTLRPDPFDRAAGLLRSDPALCRGLLRELRRVAYRMQVVDRTPLRPEFVDVLELLADGVASMRGRAAPAPAVDVSPSDWVSTAAAAASLQISES